MSEQVEWGLHCCLTLAWIGDDHPMPAARLAEWFALPPAYLTKCLQALTRAGILQSVPGARGGFRLARPPAEVTVLAVTVAIDGADNPFRCTEIRQRGAGVDPAAPEFRVPCAISTVMHRADLAWRRELAGHTLADLLAAAPAEAAERTRRRHAALPPR
ncbi:RrF2 family transcriptional regulator [Micromonospora rifamycinica]|uniref:Transcriptional regulator, BadM/Rrf2 family n=1 Tax=Micromonospora rifamycinica TaxID=291594 RepID=A0A1C5JHH8_9ACTN|nr:Rrf2 family transcriptional regulator [Micromonospora rifamycinica]SCG70035.1 transcriptional regulator, BadM/Rrf2 family [Micromonospora rifamycinica]